MKHGRPTNEEAQKAKQIIFEYYERDISPIVAARDSGVNPKTIYKYYRIWDSKKHDPDEKDFLLRIKNTKEKSIQFLDSDIIELTRDMDKIKFVIEKELQKGNIHEFDRLLKLKLKTMNQRTKIITAKINLIGTPTADVLISQEEIVA